MRYQLTPAVFTEPHRSLSLTSVSKYCKCGVPACARVNRVVNPVWKFQCRRSQGHCRASKLNCSNTTLHYCFVVFLQWTRDCDNYKICCRWAKESFLAYIVASHLSEGFSAIRLSSFLLAWCCFSVRACNQWSKGRRSWRVQHVPPHSTAVKSAHMFEKARRAHGPPLLTAAILSVCIRRKICIYKRLDACMSRKIPRYI